MANSTQSTSVPSFLQPAPSPFTGGGTTTGPSAPVGGGGGTYQASTGTYTAPSGQQYSYAAAPSGSTIIGGGGGGGGTTYTGGGTAAGITFPVVTPQTISQQEQQQALTLARQNVITARDALQRDTNYYYATHPQAEIHIVTPPSAFDKDMFYQPSFFGEIKESFGAAISLGTIGQQGVGTYFKGIISPFERVSISPKAKQEVMTGFGQMPQGTIITPTFLPSPTFQITTPREFAYYADISKGLGPEIAGTTLAYKSVATGELVSKEIQKSYQQRIDVGILPYGTEAEKSAVQAQAQTEFQKGYETTFAQISKASQLGETGIIKTNIPRLALEVGALTAGAVLMQPEIVGYETAIISQAAFGGYSLGTLPHELFTAGNIGLSLEERRAAGFAALGKGIIGISAAESVFGMASGKSLFTQYNIQDYLEEFKTKPFSSFPLKSAEVNEFRIAPGKSIFDIRLETGYTTAKLTTTYKTKVQEFIKPAEFLPSETGIPIMITPESRFTSAILKERKSTLRVADVFSNKVIEKSLEFKGGIKLITEFETARIFRTPKGFIQESFELQGAKGALGAGYLTTPGKEGFKTFKLFGIAGKEIESEYPSIILGRKVTSEYPFISGIPTKERFGIGKTQVLGDIKAMGRVKVIDLSKEFDKGFGFEFKGRGLNAKDFGFGLKETEKFTPTFGEAFETRKPITGLSIDIGKPIKEFSVKDIISKQQLEFKQGQFEGFKMPGLQLPKQQFGAPRGSVGLAVQLGKQQEIEVIPQFIEQFELQVRPISEFKISTLTKTSSMQLLKQQQRGALGLAISQLQLSKQWQKQPPVISSIQTNILMQQPKYRVGLFQEPIQEQELQFKQQFKAPPIGREGFGFKFMPPRFDFGLPGLSSFGGDIFPKPRKRGKKAGLGTIAPSFTGIVEEIKMTSPLKVSKTFGVTPRQIRGLYVTKKGKPAKGAYFRFTDL
jgi:type II secretory pathway pseudopilin PulG